MGTPVPKRATSKRPLKNRSRKGQRAADAERGHSAISRAVDVSGRGGQVGPTRAPDPLSVLGEINRKIVGMLQLDGRRSYASIARQLDLSEGTVRARVNQMQCDNHLRFIAVVDPAQLGFTSWGMLGINVVPGASPHELAQYFAARPEVTYVMVVAAKYDLLVEICCETAAELSEFLEDHCFGSAKVAAVETMVGLRLYKWFAQVPAERLASSHRR